MRGSGSLLLLLLKSPEIVQWNHTVLFGIMNPEPHFWDGIKITETFSILFSSIVKHSEREM